MTTYHKHKVDQISCKLTIGNNMYMVGQWMNMYFVDIFFTSMNGCHLKLV